MKHLYFVTLFSVLIVCAFADTPANCTHEDILGVWKFYEGARNGDNKISCADFTGPTPHIKQFELKLPDIVVDELGHKGFFTAVYNQGFEVVINQRKYFAFSKYIQNEGYVTSYCNTVFPGWSHDVMGRNWACYNAVKMYPQSEPKIHPDEKLPEETSVLERIREFVDQINQAQTSWTAFAYPELKKMKVADYILHSGGIRSQVHRSSRMERELSQHEKQLISQLPEEFDWRNVRGSNYVPPVRKQGICGSCFAFATLDMLSARLSIATNNFARVIFSPQDVISCSEYSQNCTGGFPYLAGKYAQDFGVIAEGCRPYTGKNESCVESDCKRYYASDYKYVGGYFGVCNEDVMKLELVTNGPIVAGFEAYRDFRFYRSGIYHNTGFNHPDFYLPVVNHALLVVGYGFDRIIGEKFWIAKNSYGPKWGENGFVRIRRGNNECNVESMAEVATLIP